MRDAGTSVSVCDTLHNEEKKKHATHMSICIVFRIIMEEIANGFSQPMPRDGM